MYKLRNCQAKHDAKLLRKLILPIYMFCMALTSFFIFFFVISGVFRRFWFCNFWKKQNKKVYRVPYNVLGADENSNCSWETDVKV